jgi:hypothetical protein
MNTAEPASAQQAQRGETAAAPPPVPPPTSHYWLRLLKASALVVIGVAVHVWIDGPTPALAGRSWWVLASTAKSTGSVDAGMRLSGRPMAPEELGGTAVADSPRPLATSGRDAPLRATDTSLVEIDSRGPVLFRRAVAASGPAPREVVHAGGFPMLPDAAVPMVPATHRLAVWTSGAAGLPADAVPELAEPEPRRPAVIETSPSVTPATRSVRNVEAPPSRREEASILEVLHEYETAVGRKDPQAAKAVWPALDDRALARAFNDLESHSLALEDCGVTVNSNEIARARCQGVATSLPKIGRRKPISASHEWTFNLSKSGGDWQIESAAIR